MVKIGCPPSAFPADCLEEFTAMSLQSAAATSLSCLPDADFRGFI
jgi:hypothetical protein